VDGLWATNCEDVGLIVRAVQYLVLVRSDPDDLWQSIWRRWTNNV